MESSVRLLEALSDDPAPTLRWYRSLAPALVLGRGQHLNLDAAAIPVVQRYSGGGAVLMDSGLLSLDVVLPAGHPLLDGDLGSVFERVGGAWAQALQALGVPDVTVHHAAATARRSGTPRERLLAAICYATLGRGEVAAGGRKIVGLAQRRRRAGALVQCGLLRRWEPAVLLQAFGGDAADDQVARAAVGLDELLTHPASEDDIMAMVEQALDRVEARP